jgi:hypothetical protein
MLIASLGICVSATQAFAGWRLVGLDGYSLHGVHVYGDTIVVTRQGWNASPKCFASFDRGVTWTRRDTANGWTIKPSLSPNSSRVWYGVLRGGADSQWIYLTTDAGEHWSRRGQWRNLYHTPPDLLIPSAGAVGDVMTVLGSDAWRSQDSGLTWGFFTPPYRIDPHNPEVLASFAQDPVFPEQIWWHAISSEWQEVLRYDGVSWCRHNDNQQLDSDFVACSGTLFRMFDNVGGGVSVFNACDPFRAVNFDDTVFKGDGRHDPIGARALCLRPGIPASIFEILQSSDTGSNGLGLADVWTLDDPYASWVLACSTDSIPRVRKIAYSDSLRTLFAATDDGLWAQVPQVDRVEEGQGWPSAAIAPYPNPSSESVFISLPRSISRDASFRLVDLLGRDVTDRVGVSRTSDELHLTLDDLPTGHYLLKSSARGWSVRVVHCK